MVHFTIKRLTQEAASRIPWISLLLTAAAFIIHYIPPLRPQLLYTRTALNGWDFWRIISCHWVHLNTDHLLWSALTFLVLGSFCETMNRKIFMLSIGISAVLIPIGIRFTMPDLKIYGGLSGLDCSLYALLGVTFIKREWRVRNWIWIVIYTILLCLLLAKIIYELISGLTIFVDNTQTNIVPVPLSHLIGGLVGLAAGTSISVANRNLKKSPAELRL